MQGGIIDLKMETDADVTLIPKLIRQNHSGPIILRNNQVLEPVLTGLIGNEGASENPAIKNNGVYLILGGSSGIGEEIAKHINGKFNSKIIISGTRPADQLSKQLSSLSGQNIECIQASVIKKETQKN